MAEQIAPTRSNLLQRRDQLRLAIRGADLLKRKRDALIAEFFDLVKVSLNARRALNGLLSAGPPIAVYASRVS